MGRSSRPGRHPRHLPDTPPDSNLTKSPSAASKEISGDNYINQPPKTYCPPGRRVEQSHDSQSHQHESRPSRIKPRVHDQMSYRRGGTYWDDSIGQPLFLEHQKRQSERLPGNGDRICFTVGIDTERHFRRASLTLPKPPGEAFFSTSRQPRVLQESSRQKTSGYHSKPHVPRPDETDTHVRTNHSNGARRDPPKRTLEGTKKRSNRGQENSVRPELTEENVTLNARRASPSYRPDVGDGPSRPPLMAQATTRPERGSRSNQKTRDSPANRVPIQKVRSSRGETDLSSRRVDTYPSRNHGDRVSRGRRMDRSGSRSAPTVPITVGDGQEEEPAYRARSPPLASYSIGRRSKPTRIKRQSINGHQPIRKELGLDSSPPTSDLSDRTDYSVHERRRTVKRKSTQQTTCSCTVS
jgi:hypothetical protein